MRILITGSTGFLGSSLARHWVAAGHELCLMARPTSDIHRIDDLLGRVTLVRAADLAHVIETVSEFSPDAIVHTACSYGRGGQLPLDIMDANLRLGVALLQSVLEKEGDRTLFLNASSALAPEVSLYALSKNQFSQWGAALASQHQNKLQFVDVCLQQMYGTGDDRSKFITQVVETCRLDGPYLALTLGDQQRDFIHIADVVMAYETILKQRSQLNCCESIDVGSGDAVTVRHFVELVKRLAGASTALDFGAVPYRQNEAMLCVANIKRLRSLGWCPKVSLTDGIQSMIGKS